MLKIVLASAAAVALATSVAASADAQDRVLGHVSMGFGMGTKILPESSIRRPEDAGLRAHTNIIVIRPDIAIPGAETNKNKPPQSGSSNNTPASLACVYNLVAQADACNPDKFKVNSDGGTQAIAIVDAFDAPKIKSDLAKFSKQFGLPAPDKNNFEIVFASGTRPPYNSGWETEISLDVETVHGIAPHAKIILVEAASNSNTDLLAAEAVAAQRVADAGGGEVSNSWGENEFSGEDQFEDNFAQDGVVFFASTGDSPGTEWPSVLTNIVAVGGTTIERDMNNNFQTETVWSDTDGDVFSSTGGGKSEFIDRPSFQSAVSKVVKKTRGVPDVAADANPDSGVWVYISQQGGWLGVGGTSLASPLTAAIVNLAGQFAASSPDQNSLMYANRNSGNKWFDVTQGRCGTNQSLKALTGYDLCTGIGSPRGLGGK